MEYPESNAVTPNWIDLVESGSGLVVDKDVVRFKVCRLVGYKELTDAYARK